MRFVAAICFAVRCFLGLRVLDDEAEVLGCEDARLRRLVAGVAGELVEAAGLLDELVGVGDCLRLAARAASIRLVAAICAGLRAFFFFAAIR